MTVADWDIEEETMDTVFFTSGASISKQASLMEGKTVTNMAGLTGETAEVGKFGPVICPCGYFGIGSTLQLIEALKKKGNNFITAIYSAKRSGKVIK